MSLTPTLLLILDGYGLAPAGPGNAASLARTPNIDRLISLPGATRIDASGRAVGLPAGYMGNSEVGHLNIGAGRIVYQDMTRIDVAMETGELASNAALLELLANVKRTGGRLHFAGLLSDGGVHSHINHLGALMDIAAAHGVDVRVHAFMDGRDTSPTSGAGFLAQLGDMMARTRAAHSGVSVEQASLVGRFYAMDRDKRWDRLENAYDAKAGAPPTLWRPLKPCMPPGRPTNSSSRRCLATPPTCASGTATVSSSSIFAPTVGASW